MKCPLETLWRIVFQPHSKGKQQAMQAFGATGQKRKAASEILLAKRGAGRVSLVLFQQEDCTVRDIPPLPNAVCLCTGL